MTPSVVNAKTPEELAAAIEAEYPDELEFEPGKIAVYDSDSGAWIYQAPDGSKLTIRI